MGALVTLGVNTLAFFIISAILPGFKVKSNMTSFLIAVAYSILVAIANILILPITAITAAILFVIAFIPIIGPMIAGAGALVTVFVLTFCITAILLIIIDKFMVDFEMTSLPVAFIAAFLLAVINVVIRGLLGI